MKPLDVHGMKGAIAADAKSLYIAARNTAWDRAAHLVGISNILR